MEATKKIFVSYNLRHIYGEDHEYHPNEWSFEKNQFRPRCETSEIFYKLVSGLGEKWLDTRTLEHAEALGYEVVKLRSWTGERFSGGRQRYVYRDWLIREVPHPYKPHYEIYDPHPNTWVQETVNSRLMICLDSNGFDQVATLDDYDLKDCADTLEDAVNMIDNILTKERVCS